MNDLHRVSQSVSLATPVEAMWQSAVSLRGVNYELGPWLRMTTPRMLRGGSIEEVQPGVRIGRSWILLGGVIPIDFDDLGLAEIDPPRRFLERSRMLSMSIWEHEREIGNNGTGSCVLTDRIGFRLRRPLAVIPGATALAARLVAIVFRHRHRRLADLYGTAERR